MLNNAYMGLYNAYMGHLGLFDPGGHLVAKSGTKQEVSLMLQTVGSTVLSNFKILIR